MAERIKQKKARGPNWPSDQAEIVRSEVMKNYGILFGGFSNDVDHKKKQKAWSDIADKVNSVGGTVRNVGAIKDKWKNIKNSSIATMRQHAKHSKGTDEKSNEGIFPLV
ncbi:t-SNARE domain-containing protein 1 [Nymphon striatum]|nr:t-SNARE domain-containing protein 1 [Nymphon striatum]